jgi:hypothetical protein
LAASVWLQRQENGDSSALENLGPVQHVRKARRRGWLFKAPGDFFIAWNEPSFNDPENVTATVHRYFGTSLDACSVNWKLVPELQLLAEALDE